ncbi:hypothetical protein RFI_16713, partial [Reticulomyxa filosa]
MNSSEQAKELERDGRWRRAMNKHMEASEKFEECRNVADNKEAMEILDKLIIYHTTRANEIKQILAYDGMIRRSIDEKGYKDRRAAIRQGAEDDDTDDDDDDNDNDKDKDDNKSKWKRKRKGKGNDMEHSSEAASSLWSDWSIQINGTLQRMEQLMGDTLVPFIANGDRNTSKSNQQSVLLTTAANWNESESNPHNNNNNNNDNNDDGNEMFFIDDHFDHNLDLVSHDPSTRVTQQYQALEH